MVLETEQNLNNTQTSPWSTIKAL